MVTHGQGHQRSRLQPQYRSWGSSCPCKLKTGITKSSSWLNHKRRLVSAQQGQAPRTPQPTAHCTPITRAESEASCYFPSNLPATHPNLPLSPARCPEAPEPTLGDLQSICGGAPREPQQQLLSAVCNYIPGKGLIDGT